MRKSGIAALGFMAAALVAAGCGGGSNDSGGSGAKVRLNEDLQGASKAPACQAAPVSGGDLVYARQQITENLDTIKVVNGNGDIFASNMLFQGLTRPDPKGTQTVVGGIADKWEAVDGGKAYTFHLRPGAKFSDGSPITVEDVKYSLDRFGNPKINQTLAAVAVGYKSTEIVDKENVKVNLQFPVAAFPYNISIWPGAIVPKKLIEKQGEAFWKNPVGSGPFKLGELKRGSHITFERNPNYWDKGKPYLNTVRFDFATDSNSRILSLKDGQAQIADGIPFSQVNSLKGSKELTLQVSKIPLFVALWFNHKRPPLADLQVRQAMQYALDKEEINKAIFRGVGTIPNSQLQTLKYDAPDDQVKPYPFDVKKAKELMSQSGFKDGFNISLGYPAGYDYYKQLGLFLQNAWSQIGIKVKLLELDQASLTDRFFSGKYDMVFPFSQFTSDLPVPDEYAQFVAEPKSGTNGFFSFWKDAKITAMVRKFVQTTDEDSRAEQWPEIQQALNDQSPWINVMDLPNITAHGNDVCGTNIDALGSDHLEDTWIAKG